MLLRFRDKHVFAFNAEIQDGHQKWRENNFCKKSSVNSADTLRVKNFIEIALSHSVIEINVFLHLMQKFQMATKSGRKTIFAKKSPVNSADTLRVYRDRRVFALDAEIHDGRQKWRENDFFKKVASRLCGYPVGQKLRRKSLKLAQFPRYARFCVFSIKKNCDI